jgi:hypothetical protein
MTMNDPVMSMLSAMQSGRNPSLILRQLATTNPQARQVMQMVSGKSPDQLRQMAENLAANQGTTIEDVARSLGISIPSNR